VAPAAGVRVAAGAGDGGVAVAGKPRQRLQPGDRIQSVGGNGGFVGSRWPRRQLERRQQRRPPTGDANADECEGGDECEGEGVDGPAGSRARVGVGRPLPWPHNGGSRDIVGRKSGPQCRGWPSWRRRPLLQLQPATGGGGGGCGSRRRPRQPAREHGRDAMSLPHAWDSWQARDGAGASVELVG